MRQCRKYRHPSLLHLPDQRYNMLYAAPFLENRHVFSLTLEKHQHSVEVRNNAGSLRLLTNACTFSVLVCVFNFFAVTVLPGLRWKWSQFLSLFLSFLLLASSIVTAMSLFNLLNLSGLLSLPENMLIYQWPNYSFRGNSALFSNWLKISMLLGLLLALPASVCNMSYWKQELTGMLKRSRKIRQAGRVDLDRIAERGEASEMRM